MKKKKVRVRSRRLDRLDETKLAVAIWLMARDLVEDKTTPPPEDVQGSIGSAPSQEAM